MATYADDQFNQADDDLTGQGRRQPPRSEDDIVEAIPEWIQALLQKYDEHQGPLAGIQDLYAPASTEVIEPEDDLGDISDVLEDIAVDAPKPQTGRLASSVDWGVAAESQPPEPPSAMDDFLASFEEPTIEDTRPEPTSEDEDDNWLSNLDLLSRQSETEQTDTTATQAQAPSETPDWLSELSASKSQTGELATPQESQAPGRDSQEASDWLGEAEPLADELSAPEAAVEDDLPDWASVAGALQSWQADEEETSSGPDDIFEGEAELKDVDDSIADEVPGIPDWLLEFAADQSDISRLDVSPSEAPAQDEPSSPVEIPDWLAELDAAQAKEVAQPETDEPDVFGTVTASEEGPGFDWLDDLELSATGGQTPVESETSDVDRPPDTVESPMSAETLEEGEFPWRTQPSGVEEGAIPDEDLSQDEAWLHELALHYPADPAAQAEISDETVLLSEDESVQEVNMIASEAAEATAGLPDEVTDIVGPQGGTEASPEIEEGETPDWLAALRAESSPPEIESPTWEEGEFAAELPDWLSGAEPSELAAEIPAESLETEPAEDEAEMADWLGTLPAQEIAVTEEGPALEETEDEAGLPDWLAGIEEEELEADVSAEVVEDEADMSHWLSDLQKGDELPEAEAPDWLATLQREAEGPEAEAPAAEAEEEVQDSEFEEELPAWPGEAEASDPVETEAETPLLIGEDDTDLSAWLSGLRTEASPPVEDISAAEEAGFAVDLPDWLAGVDEDEEQLETEAPVEVERPALGGDADWAAEPSLEVVEPPADKEFAARDAEFDEDIPDWLTELEAEAKTVTEPGLPAWLIQTKPPEAEAEISDVQPEADLVSEQPSDLATEGGPSSESAEGEMEVEKGIETPTMMETGALAPELPDWMTGLEDETISEVPIVEEEAEQDWLAALRTEAVEEETVVEEPSEAVPAAPDYMKETEEDFEVTTTAEEDLTELTPDWLLAARIEADETAEAVEEETPLSGEAAESLLEAPEWMQDRDEQPDIETPADDGLAESAADLFMGAAESETIATEEAAYETAVPDWMAGLAEETETGELVEEEKAESDLDWLSTLQAGPAQTEDPQFVADLPDWMTQLEEETEADTTTGEDEADWLSELRVSETAEETPETEETGFVAALPDWMTSLEEKTEIDGLAERVEEPETDSLAELGSTETEERAIAATEIESEAPDWLAQLELEEEPEVETPPDEKASDWLSELRVEMTQEETGVEEMASDLSGQLAQEGPEASETPAEIDIFEAEAESTLDWLSGLEQEVGTGDTSPFGSVEPGEDALDWMTDLEVRAADEAASPQEAEIQDDFEALLPDQELVEADLARLLAQAEAPETDIEIEKDLPVDYSDKTGADDAVADIGDVLSLPAGAQETLATPDLTEASGVASRDAARQFFDIATAIPETRALPEERESDRPWSRRILRASLYLVFLLMIAIPLFNHFDRGGFPFPWLEPSPIEQQSIRNRLQGVLGDKLPGSIALVSFDYTPATEGEMDPLALEVVKKLRGQGLRVIAMSLEPEGSAMAQRILDRVAPDGYGNDTLNLGYRAGGPVAVRQLDFANPLDGPVDFVTGQAYRDFGSWPEINHLGDIGLIVAISATPDPPRWWVEQLEAIDRPPMLAVVSAAAEPFVFPYVDSGQYDALIAGINGAAALEAARVQETLGPASSMLDSQSLAHLAIMTLMLFGTIAGLFEKYGQETM